MKLLAAITALLAVTPPALAQDSLPIVRSNATVISIRDGAELRIAAWRLVPEANPDVYEASLIEGRPHRVTFITDIDSIGFLVELGKKYDFVVLKDGIRHYTQIVGTRFVPAARFDTAYRAAHRGRTLIEVPEAYELVNIAIALTPTAIQDRGLVYKNSEYYARMRAWFAAHAADPIVAALDSVLQRNRNAYFTLKMNGYAFEFDRNGRIVKGRTYDRTGFTGERANSLEPYVPRLQSFADASRFREFYRQNRHVYEEQIAFYRDTANIAEMKRWLERNFPGAQPYQSYKIVFSPLVAYNQSVTWFDSEGFKELQPHINFPYPADLGRGNLQTLSPRNAKLFRGNIAFTEINHGYINPEADKYADRIAKAISNRNYWVDSAMGPGYYGGNGAFNEYLNWVLVNLRIADNAAGPEEAAMIAAVENMMVTGRGFPRFAEFSRFLVPLYVSRPAGTTLADLYPQIIAWFEQRNRSAQKP